MSELGYVEGRDYKVSLGGAGLELSDKLYDQRSPHGGD